MMMMRGIEDEDERESETAWEQRIQARVAYDLTPVRHWNCSDRNKTSKYMSMECTQGRCVREE